MIDSVSSFFPDQEIDPGKLTDIAIRSEARFTARLGHLRITQTEKGAYIIGSWPKYAVGSNVEGLSREGFIEAVEAFERDTGLVAGRSRVYRLEIGATIAVSRPPCDYLAGWESVPRMQKDTYAYGQSVLFRNKTRSFTGYDKRAEARGESMPLKYDGHGALRIEYRQKRRIDALFGRNVSLRDLASPKVRARMLKIWHDGYRSIVKRGVVDASLAIDTPRALEKGLASIAVREIGYERLKCYIDESARNGTCSRTNACRMRTALKDLGRDSAHGTPNDLTLELDERVRDFIRNAS